MGIIRATHERSFKPLEGGQLNKGGREGGRWGSKEVRSGKWKEEERKGKEREIIERTAATQHGILYNPKWEWKNPEEQEPRVPGEKGKLLRLSVLAILTLGLCLSCLTIQTNRTL